MIEKQKPKHENITFYQSKSESIFRKSLKKKKKRPVGELGNQVNGSSDYLDSVLPYQPFELTSRGSRDRAQISNPELPWKTRELVA